MRQFTTKRAKQNAAAEPVRKSLKRRLKRCEFCGQPAKPKDLTLHEIARGSGLRLKCLDKLYGLLCAHWLAKRRGELVGCHARVAAESQARQLARLKLSRPGDYDLVAFNFLVRPAATERITAEEVEAEVAKLRAEGYERLLRPTATTKDFS